MNMAYRCPGVDEYGRGLNAKTVHMNGCCAAFALMSSERKAEIGLRLPASYVRGDLPRPPAPAAITMNQLAALIQQMIARAEQYPDEEPPGAEVWVEYGPSHSLSDVQALAELGRPYNLVLGHRRVPTDPEEK